MRAIGTFARGIEPISRIVVRISVIDAPRRPFVERDLRPLLGQQDGSGAQELRDISVPVLACRIPHVAPDKLALHQRLLDLFGLGDALLVQKSGRKPELGPSISYRARCDFP